MHAGGAGDLSAEVLTNLAYPLGDLLLLGLVVAIFGLSGWRPGRAWVLLGLGLMLSAVADGIYLLQTVEGTYARARCSTRSGPRRRCWSAWPLGRRRGARPGRASRTCGR